MADLLEWIRSKMPQCEEHARPLVFHLDTASSYGHSEFTQIIVVKNPWTEAEKAEFASGHQAFHCLGGSMDLADRKYIVLRYFSTEPHVHIIRKVRYRGSFRDPLTINKLETRNSSRTLRSFVFASPEADVQDQVSHNTVPYTVLSSSRQDCATASVLQRVSASSRSTRTGEDSTCLSLSMSESWGPDRVRIRPTGPQHQAAAGARKRRRSCVLTTLSPWSRSKRWVCVRVSV